MNSGRPPIPDSQKIIQGTFKPSRAKDNAQAKPLTEAPKPGKALRGHKKAIAEWKRVAPLLIEQGTLAEVDLSALESYCLAYERMLDAEMAVARYQEMHDGSLVMVTPNGYSQQIPELSIATVARKECREYMNLFGMSPASRTRIKVQKKDTATNDPMEALLNGTR
jgi:P27 family predicted phage terminase small subunit